MPMRGEQTTLAILAGGRGARLGGVAKGLLSVEGVTVVERLLRLRSLFADALLIANDPAPYQRFSLPIHPDLVADRGAPGGVHAAICHARTEWVLAVACDLPFVSAAVVTRLLDEQSDEVDAVCFEAEGTLQPLPGVFRRSLARVWEPRLAEGPSFRALLDPRSGARARILPEAALREVDPSLRSIQGVNVPGDLVRLGVSLPDDRG